MTEEEVLSLSTARGWPSAAYFVEVYCLYVCYEMIIHLQPSLVEDYYSGMKYANRGVAMYRL
ncbi:hypothetical protein TRIUR3_14745 [Triticum urartu]|uniref:Uncharacterized protein n=1 Tax=Triticum urartu TaxID=4572 RepID=M7ZRV1_TRIUA|nr:hypothetical protein TRIUR3_14745 [Triticum urartu]